MKKKGKEEEQEDVVETVYMVKYYKINGVLETLDKLSSMHALFGCAPPLLGLIGFNKPCKGSAPLRSLVVVILQQ